MNFTVELTAWTYLLPGSTFWAAQYYDPGRAGWVDSGWHSTSEAAPFSGVSSGGFLAVGLYDGTTLTAWVYSGYFNPSDGDTWTFWLYNHGQPGDMVLKTSGDGAATGVINYTNLEYSGIIVPMPVSNLAIGTNAKLHIGAMNTSSTTKVAHVLARVWGPDGILIHLFDQTDHFAAPNEQLEFHYDLGGVFQLNEVGTYGMRVYLYLNDVLTVKKENVTVCTVIAIPTIPTFTLDRPTANPVSALPGSVTLTCPITVSNAPTAVSFQVKCIVYEGSILPGAGTRLWEQTQTVSFASGAHTVQFTHPSAVGTIDRRDVGVEVYYGGVKVKDDQWDDVFYVTQIVPTGLHTTSIDCTYNTYDFGVAVPYVLGYEYKGEAQGGTLMIELGTGVYPLFTPAAVIGPVSYNFTKKESYTRVTENRTFVIPSTLQRGQVYSVRVTLTTADGLTDGDIDYTALKVLDITVPSTDLSTLSITTSYRDYALGEAFPLSISYKYKGIAQGGTLQTIIGRGLIFTQVYAYTPEAIQYIRSDVLATVNRDLSITLPKTLEPGQVYSIKVTLTTSDGKSTDAVKGSAFKIASTEIPEDPGVGTYRKIKDYTYPYAAGYRGAASEATVEITIPLAQLPGTDWISQRVIDEFEEGVAEKGAHMLKLVVYERERGLTSKDYKLIATATKPKEVAGQEYTPQGIVNLAYVTPQLGAAGWAIVLLGILLAIGFILAVVVPIVREGIWGEGGFVETVTGVVSTIGNLVPMMMIMMMMTIMMEQTRGLYEPPGTPPRPKPVSEAAVKAAKWVGRGAVELAKKGWEEAKELAAEALLEWRIASTERKAEKLDELRKAEERVAESRRELEKARAESKKAEEKGEQ